MTALRLIVDADTLVPLPAPNRSRAPRTLQPRRISEHIRRGRRGGCSSDLRGAADPGGSVLSSEIGGADEAGLLPGAGDDYGDGGAVDAGGQVLGEALAHGRQKDVTGLSQAAGEHDDLGIENGAQVGQADAQGVAQAGVALQGGGIVLAGGGGDGLAGDPVGIPAGEFDDAGGVVGAECGQLPAVDTQGGARAVALQAPSQAATAGAPVGDDGDVADFGGEAGGAAHEAAVDDDGTAHAGAQGDDEDVGLARRGAEPGLGPAGGVGVVLDDDTLAGALGDFVGDARPGPVEVGAVDHGVAIRGGEAGGADADGGGVVVDGEFVDHVGDGGEDGVAGGGR